MIPIWLICQNDPEFIAVLISSRKLALLSFGYWEKREKDGPCVDDTSILASVGFFLAFFSKPKDQNFKTQPNLWQNSRILFNDNDVIKN